MSIFVREPPERAFYFPGGAFSLLERFKKYFILITQLEKVINALFNQKGAFYFSKFACF